MCFSGYVIQKSNELLWLVIFNQNYDLGYVPGIRYYPKNVLLGKVVIELLNYVVYHRNLCSYILRILF